MTAATAAAIPPPDAELSAAECLRLLRPLNLLLIAVAVLVGAAHVPRPPFPALLWAVAGAVLVAAAGYAANDLGDRERDRVNHPRRPLARRGAGERRARRLAGGCAAAGLACGWAAGAAAGALIAGWVGGLLLYERAAKARAPWGNLLVSALASSPLLLGALVAGEPGAALPAAGVALLFHLAREIWKDAADEPGDGPTGLRTLAVRHGTRNAMRWAAACLLATCAAGFLAHTGGNYNAAYLAVFTGGVAVPLAWLAVAAWRRPASDFAAAKDGILKLGMVAALCAFSVGPI